MCAVALLAACSAPTEWEPLPLRDLASASARSAPELPAVAVATDEQISAGWPAHVSPPAFMGDELPSFVGSAQGKSALLQMSEEPNHAEVSSYIALLLSQGFTVDSQAANPGWFVRDGREWVALQNLPTDEYLKSGDFSKPPDSSGAFQVTWTTDPARHSGYCRIYEGSQGTCRL